VDTGARSVEIGTIPDRLEDQTQEVLKVLRRARYLIYRDGWLQREFDIPPSDLAMARGWSLHYAIAEAAAGEDGRPHIRVEWTRRLIRKLTGHNIPEWNDHPLRTKRDVIALLDRAIELGGGRAPRSGGHHVSHGPGGAR
jgi:hypothetical protein